MSTGCDYPIDNGHPFTSCQTPHNFPNFYGHHPMYGGGITGMRPRNKLAVYQMTKDLM